MVLKVGDTAPDFSGTDQDGNEIRLSSFIGKKNVVLYFYPKDFSAGCTVETKKFSSLYGELSSMDTEVIGISSDDPDTHKRFAKECGASFKLISDREGAIAKLYDVKRTLGLIPGRVTYVIDKNGKIVHVYSSQLSPSRHAEEAMKIVSELFEKQIRA